MAASPSSSTTSEPFQYTALPGSRAIRLLEILDDQPSSPMRFSLHTYNLDEVPKFEALSYTWDNPLHENSSAFRESLAITCNGKTLDVKRNLHEALIQLHQPYIVDYVDSRWERTALHWAAERGRHEELKVQLQKGASVTAGDRRGYTPLHCAAYNGHAEIIKTLLEAGANPMQRDYQGLLALDRTRELKQTTAMEILSKVTTLVTGSRDTTTSTSELHKASKQGDLQSVRNLIRVGHEIDLRDDSGRTALHHAALHGHLDIVRELVGAGANHRALDLEYATPYHLARDGNRTEVVKWLWRHGESEVAASRPSLHVHEASSRSRPRYVWIDAICIDQSNIDERSSQVALMSDIYQSAESVRVWFGRKDETSELGIRSLRRLATIMGQAEGLVSHVEPFTLADETAMLDFLCRRWFQRCWIIQELLLARQIVCHCGDEQIVWEDIFDALLAFNDWGYGGDLQRQNATSEKQLFALRVMRRLQVLREWYTSHRDKQNYWDLNTLVPTTKEFQCAVQHDKIFSLLGVARETEARRKFLPTPDYTMPVKDAYCAATMLMIEESESLTILEFGQGERMKDRSVPSWVPFEAVDPPLDRLNAGSHTYWSTGQPPLQGRIRPSTQQYVLRLEAAKVADVSAVESNTLSKRWTYDPRWTRMALLPDSVYPPSETRAEALRQTILGGASGFHQLQSRLEYYRRDGGFLFKDWVRISFLTLAERGGWHWEDLDKDLDELGRLAETDPDGRFPTASEVKSCSGIVDWRTLRGDRWAPNDLESRWLSDITMTGRNIFTTSQGHIGKGPLSTQVGDTVWLIPGSNVLFLLRMVGTGRYVSVGDSYVHGIMGGELLENEVLNFEEIEIE